MLSNEFPKWKYHRTLPARVVNGVEQEQALGLEWADHPSAFDAKPLDPGPPAETDPEAEAKPAKPRKAK